MTDLLTREEWTKRAAQKVARTQLFIDGKFVDSASGKTFESVNPRDNTVVANVAEGDKQDIDRAVAAFPYAEDIFDANMATLNRLGLQGWQDLNVGPSLAHNDNDEK